MNQNYNRGILFNWLEQGLISSISEHYDDQSIEQVVRTRTDIKSLPVLTMYVAS